MRRFIALLALTLMCHPMPTMAQATTMTPTIPIPSGYQLSFQDEFDGDVIDLAKWSLLPNDLGTYNGEQQAYQENAVTVDGGILHLTATDAPGVIFGEAMPYTSGLIQTQGKFSQMYGVFEIRAKMPAGQGLWPAFWMMPDDLDHYPPEIDILEILGNNTNQVYFAHHWGPDAEHTQELGSDFVGPDFAGDYHTFTVSWTPTSLTWYVDGVEQFSSTTNLPDEPMYMLVNLAVGGEWPGSPDASTNFPASLEVDYVRVFQAS